MTKCVEKLGHHTETCNSSDGLQVFQNDDGSYSGYCFSCGTFIPNPYSDKPEGYAPKKKTRSQKDIASELLFIKTFPFVSLPARKLRKETFEYFGCRTAVSEADGTKPMAHYYPYRKQNRIVSYKARLLEEKKMWVVGPFKGVEPFGWKEAIMNGGGKTLFICEGEIDAMSLWQIFRDSSVGTKWADLIPAVISVPNGAGGASAVIAKYLMEMEKRWENIIFVPDMDEAGQKAADQVARLSPTIKVAELPCKDVNECLMEGREKAVKNAVMFKAQAKKNTRIIKGTSLIAEAKKKPEMGIAWPWEGMTKATRGKRRGDVIYYGAGVKMGKSELVDSLAADDIVNARPVLMVKPEQQPHQTYKRLVGKVAGRIFHDPNIPFDEKAFDTASEKVGDLALILDNYQFVDWSTLQGDILYAVKSEGVKDLYLDPITCFTNTMGTAEANEHLTKMTAEIAAMAKDYQFTAHIFCHLKAPNAGDPHEMGGRVMSTQFAGSRAMMRVCQYMIGIEGNKDSTLPREERNTRDLVILEDREFGCSDRITLYWNDKTGLFTEVKSED